MRKQLLFTHSSGSRWAKNSLRIKYCFEMILKWLFLTFLSLRECTPNFGKIKILNKSYMNIRVTLSPSINWNYYEQRTNHSLFRNPDKIIGGNIIV